MPSELTLTEKKDGVGIITLNRPAKLNAMNNALTQAIHMALTEFEEADDVKVVIMTGAGERAFSAGADIHEEAALTKENYITREDFNKWHSGVDNTWHVANFKKPTICALNGLAYGGGAYLAAAFDIRIGCDRSSFRFLAVKAGLVSGTWTLPMIVGFPIAKELLFTGRVINAGEAYRIGLLNHLVPAAEVLPASIDMAKEIAGNYQSAVRGLKDILNHNIGMGLSEMHNNEKQTVIRSVTMPNPKDSFAGFLKSHEKK
ncbi:MAG: enoyl-CoA hydratase/isomerase family protein [Chloroflexota bacterium]